MRGTRTGQVGVEKRLSTPYGKRSIYLLLETEIDLSWGKDFLHSEGIVFPGKDKKTEKHTEA